MAIRQRLRSLFKWLGIAVAAWLVLTVLVVLALRWIDPPTSAFMLQRWVAGHFESGAPPYVYHEWVDWESIPRRVALAAVAAEDQRFPRHDGFDLVEIERAWKRYQAGGRLRGASTISQQTAKNLFLWSGRDPLRKGLEAGLTLLIEAMWPKQRILEVYLNIAQFSPDTFGVGAAAWRYFDRPVVALDTGQAALLAAVLPNPEYYRLEAPSTKVRGRADWIRRQMRNLGGAAYLERL
jgi:monofunctional biosynthetic peptidoglycan transglycosylase